LTIGTTVASYSISGAIPTTATQVAVFFEYDSTGTAGAAEWFQVENVQLEASSTATPFRRNANSIEGELAACQRYYWRAGGDNAYERIAEGFFTTTTIASVVVFNPVTMRVSPVSIEWNTLGLFDGPGVKTVTNVVQVGGGKNSFAIEVTIASGGTANRPLQLTTNNSTSGFFGVSAEL
jgi:hypothetical protein